jgi:hypothetical protein
LAAGSTYSPKILIGDQMDTLHLLLALATAFLSLFATVAGVMTIVSRFAKARERERLAELIVQARGRG